MSNYLLTELAKPHSWTSPSSGKTTIFDYTKPGVEEWMSLHTPLTEAGLAAAYKAGQTYTKNWTVFPDVIYTSNMERAKETSRAMIGAEWVSENDEPGEWMLKARNGQDVLLIAESVSSLHLRYPRRLMLTPVFYQDLCRGSEVSRSCRQAKGSQ